MYEGKLSRRSILKALAGSSAISAVAPAVLAKHPGHGKQEQAFIYLDHSERTKMVSTAVLTTNQKLLKKTIRRTKKARLARVERNRTEVKASEATDRFKEYFFSRFRHFIEPHRRKDVEIYNIYLDKRRYRGDFKENRGLIFLAMTVALIDMMPLSRYHDVFVYPNRSALLKGIPRGDFIAAIRHFFLERRIHFHRRFEVFPHHSRTDEHLQATDFLNYALFQKREWNNRRWSFYLRPFIRREMNALRRLGI